MSWTAKGPEKGVALITGAAGGIGRGLARAFGEAGYSLALTDIRQDELDSLCAGFVSAGMIARSYVTDIADPRGVRAMVTAVESEVGPVEVLLNNAAVFSAARIEDLTDEEWDRVQAVNVKGTLHCSAAVFPAMRERSRGAIVNLASLAGKRGRTIFGKPGDPAWAAYTVSKASVAALTLAMAFEWAPYGIRVNAVAPGPVLTGFQDEAKQSHASELPVGRIGTPEDVAQAALFLASPAASFIVGEILDVNGGLIMD